MKVLIKTMQWKAFGLKVQEQKPSLLFCCGRMLYLPERLMCGGLFFFLGGCIGSSLLREDFL